MGLYTEEREKEKEERENFRLSCKREVEKSENFRFSCSEFVNLCDTYNKFRFLHGLILQCR